MTAAGSPGGVAVAPPGLTRGAQTGQAPRGSLPMLHALEAHQHLCSSSNALHWCKELVVLRLAIHLWHVLGST